ncbi:Nramp family divalent metal transporter [Candidatus Purcelliella pentastirinorum]|uniref:Divalent metal cation transporter MntH n=1 Tax=Candidatus Purcelliella pentastirinorum TaxID=472834 RepID=A0AAX3NAU9_9ENTR|nr:Nramp family divalent metal transporter [Candidatus Purcelliella pentastirinorum]WDI78590.1 Nramp family divalent metal transporter [Candidatus Purcelliella pentastirinorum]WDR80382.1 Nramp family divalent metal transporter [Candidatus Purcelliella pentastirinorum]
MIQKNKNKSNKTNKLIILGPAFIAAIGYIDPGNFATNIQAGAAYGYTLLWVVTLANIMAILIQLMSAKLGIATNKNLAEHIRDNFPKPIVWFYWIQAEIIAMATDLAEFLGATIGIKLITNISLPKSAIIVGILTFLILTIQKKGQKTLEIIIGILLLLVATAYLIELFYSKPKLSLLIKGLIIPSLPTTNAVFLSAGILGATIMPHVIYLHSSLTQYKTNIGTKKELYSSTKIDIALAMTIASFINLAMLATSSAVFYYHGVIKITDLNQAYLTLKPLLNQAAATIFGLSLIAAGISSTVVGTLAGQIMMQGFINFYIPVWIRRIITILPSFIIILIKLNPTTILIISQVLLSFGISLALIPLLSFTGNKKIMGELVNSKFLQKTGWVIVTFIITINIYLIVKEIIN